MKIFHNLYDKTISLMFGILVCAVPTMLLTLILPAGLALFMASGVGVIAVAAVSYRMIKKNRAERRFFLDETERG